MEELKKLLEKSQTSLARYKQEEQKLMYKTSFLLEHNFKIEAQKVQTEFETASRYAYEFEGFVERLKEIITQKESEK